MLDRVAIATMIPHAGRMCLLDKVLRWDELGISCSAASHRDADNPLRDPAGLATTAGIEYAAQAAAIHGYLRKRDAVPRMGVLAALKNVDASRRWLHDVAQEIIVEATLLHSDQAGGIYTFALFAGAERLLSGQFTLMYRHDPEDPSA